LKWSAASVITFVGGFSLYALMFLLPLFYQQIRGETVLDTGLLLIPQGLGTMLFLVLSRRLAARLDGRFIVAGGVILTMIGVLPFALAGAACLRVGICPPGRHVLSLGGTNGAS
jgi:MFS family permease